MKRRHVYANPGEYIVVHRKHDSSSNDDNGCMIILGTIIFGILLIVIYWKVILACLICAFIIWMLWYFRAPIGNAICWIAKQLWRLISMCTSKIVNGIRSIFLKPKDLSTNDECENIETPHSAFVRYDKSSPTYGKIIQKKSRVRG